MHHTPDGSVVNKGRHRKTPQALPLDVRMLCGNKGFFWYLGSSLLDLLPASSNFRQLLVSLVHVDLHTTAILSEQAKHAVCHHRGIGGALPKGRTSWPLLQAPHSNQHGTASTNMNSKPTCCVNMRVHAGQSWQRQLPYSAQ